MNFFDEGSPYLGHPLLTTERTAAELDRIDELLVGITPEASVLDLGCGFGRHALALAGRGHSVVGIDPSAVMIDAAQQAANTLHGGSLNVSFHVATAADASPLVAPGSVDLALCLFTTFGQRTNDQPFDASTTQLLRAAARALKPGGVLVLELPDRDRAITMLVPQEQLGPTTVTRTFDPHTSVLSEQFETPDNTFELAYQLFDREEVRSLLGDAGFVVEMVLDSALVPPPPTFMTLVARQAE